MIRIKVSTEVNASIPLDGTLKDYCINPSKWKNTGELMIFSYNDEDFGRIIYDKLLDKFGEYLVELCEE